MYTVVVILGIGWGLAYLYLMACMVRISWTPWKRK